MEIQCLLQQPFWVNYLVLCICSYASELTTGIIFLHEYTIFLTHLLWVALGNVLYFPFSFLLAYIIHAK